MTRADVERARGGCVIANMGHTSSEIELDWLQTPTSTSSSSASAAAGTQIKAAATAGRPPLNKSASSASTGGAVGGGVGSPKTGSGPTGSGSGSESCSTPVPDVRFEGVEHVRPLVDHIRFADGRHVVLLAEGSPLNLATAAVPSFVVSVTATALVRTQNDIQYYSTRIQSIQIQ